MYLVLSGSKPDPNLLCTINYQFFFNFGLQFHLTMIVLFLIIQWITFIITSRELSYFLPSCPILPASPADNVVVVELLTEVLPITPGASVLRGDVALTGRVGAGVVVVVVVLVVGTVTPENFRIAWLTSRRVRTINNCGEHSQKLLCIFCISQRNNTIALPPKVVKISSILF